jgi:hypothetical protein
MHGDWIGSYINIFMKSWFLSWNTAAFIKFIDIAIQQLRHQLGSYRSLRLLSGGLCFSETLFWDRTIPTKPKDRSQIYNVVLLGCDAVQTRR